jgi:glycosyltransferase involved in cell wall biosynthesis
MLKNIYFSLVIPTLNEERYLPGLLDDISKQLYRNFETIIVDGNSDDNTVKKAKEYKKYIKGLKIYIVNKRNVSFQRNYGASKSIGKYVVFIDADTKIDNDYFLALKRKLDKDCPDAFSTSYTSVGKKLFSKIFSFINSGSYWIMSKFGLSNAPGCLMGLKRKVFITIRGFSETVEFAEDRELIRRCTKQGYKFKFYLNPKYRMSLRRVEKYGILKYLLIYFIVNIKREFKKKIDRKNEYPMGGEIYK